MGPELLKQEWSSGDDPTQASPTQKQETDNPSEAKRSDTRDEQPPAKIFGSKQYAPLPPIFGDKPHQIPKHEFHPRVDNFNGRGKAGPKKGELGNPTILKPSPTSVTETNPSQSPATAQNSAPAKDPPPESVPPEENPSKEPPPKEPPPQPAQKPEEDFDAKLVQDVSQKVEELQSRPDLHPELQRIQESLEALSRKVLDNEDVTKVLNTILQRLEEVKSQEHPVLQEVKAAVKHIEGAMVEIQNQPSKEYTQVLQILDALLEKANSQANDEMETLEKVRAAVEELNKHPQIDEPEALRNIEKSLDVITNSFDPVNYAPELKALSKTLESKMEEHLQNSNTHFKDVKGRIEDVKNLNSGFDDLRSDVRNLLEIIGKEDSTIVTQLQAIDKILNERPGLDINRDELFNRLKTIQISLDERPPLNQKEIQEQLYRIEKKCATIDFQGVFTDLTRVEGKVDTLILRPTVSPNEMRQVIQGVHDNIDEVKKNPIMNSKPLLTQEKFERTIGPLAVIISDLASERERGQAMLDVIQNVHHGIVENNRKPSFDPKPIIGLSRQIEANYHADQKNYETIKAKLDRIVLDDGSFGAQVKELRSEFKHALDSDKVQRKTSMAEMEKKISTLTKVGGGALIVSAITAIGFFGWKLFGRKKKEGGTKKSTNEVVNKKIGKRLHARSWNDGSNLVVPANWDGTLN